MSKATEEAYQRGYRDGFRDGWNRYNEAPYNPQPLPYPQPNGTYPVWYTTCETPSNNGYVK